MFERDVAVIEAAETLVQKWREFDNNGQGEDPEDYAEALAQAVDARREDLKPTEPTPTPSITVGTQVRLTGVVTGSWGPKGDQVMVDVGCDIGLPLNVGGNSITLKPEHLEVIRQPFKRGEVVYSCGAVATGDQYVVFNDEFEGRIDVVHCPTGTATTNNDASRFERRP